ncbi:rhomboid family intramembrane serine protease [Pedobacter sp. KR3-3]|uniref:Rhomboid family intramembrane serine protease n=1 Tax=Pedobacter albus TaxID=3113905 RepID=A0ABU7I338_9SPHI|nr:rhomboid family intramembrane serine protease [Pedobacter sp. KR3-3]MEE1943822.1 rhomboid family intramembrane serine protease [Pedobacter sp. KR3-3]
MAFGFTPKHTEELRVSPLEAQPFLAAAVEAAKTQGLNLMFMSETGFIVHTDNGFFKSNFEIKLLIKGETATLTSSSLGSEMFDFGKNKKNVVAFILALDDAKQQFTAEELQQKFEALQPELAPEEDDFLKLPPSTAKEDFVDFFKFFMPRQGFFITPILIWLNVGGFVLMTINGASILNPSSEILLQWGANFRPATLNGQWWRLLSNCFLHIGIVHLLFNMFALVYVAIFLEPMLGRSRFLVAYLLTGIVASITSLSWHELTISAGASGAIFGLYGVLLALLCTSLVEQKARKALLISMGIFVAYNLIYGLKGDIDNAAHIGGLLSGFVIGFAFVPSLKRTQEPAIKYFSIGFLALVVLVCSGVTYDQLKTNEVQIVMPPPALAKADNPSDDPDFDQVAYDKLMTDFHSVESLALNIFPIDTTAAGREKSLSDIKDVGIYYWKRGIEILDELDKQGIHPLFAKRNKVLRHYCEENIKTYELMYKAVEEGTHEYDNEINARIKQTGELLNTIKRPHQKR